MCIPDGVRETRWPVRHTTPDHLMPLTFRRTARLGRARVNVSKSGLMVSRRVGW